MNAPAGTRSRIDPGAHPVRGAARDPAQHQGRRIFRLVRARRSARRRRTSCMSRGTMNLYHYRPIADEIYRVPILIVMATTNRGYILDMVPGQSFIEFLLKRGYDVYMLDWTAPRPEEKSAADGGLRPRLHPGLRPPRAAGFRRDRRHRDRLLLRRRAVAALRLDLQRRADEEPDLLHHADRFPRDEAVLRISPTAAISTSTGWSTASATCRRR